MFKLSSTQGDYSNGYDGVQSEREAYGNGGDFVQLPEKIQLISLLLDKKEKSGTQKKRKIEKVK